MDDFDREVSRIHRRRVIPSLLFSKDTLIVAIIVAFVWFVS